MNKKLLASVLSIAVAASSLAAVSSAATKKVTLTYLVDNTPATVTLANAMVDAFEKKYPDISINIEQRPGGTEGDNIVKTRLATGDMADVFAYNTGSLFQALNAPKNMLDLTKESFLKNINPSFFPAVTVNKKVYATPSSTASSGGIFYNKKIYAELGLSVPKTWKEFISNNDKIKKAGYTAVIGTYKTAWTSQLLLLADFYNVNTADPDFVSKYTSHKDTYYTNKAAFKGFQRIAEVYTKKYMNADYLSTTYDAGVKMLLDAKGAHYPMLSFAVSAMKAYSPEKLKDIGFFAQPGDDANKHGLTTWMPGGLYIYKNTKNAASAKKFLEFYNSTAGIEVQKAKGNLSGPYLVKGAKLPDEVPGAIKDMEAYFDKDNATFPALEYLSPIKGPNLPQILVEVGSGRNSASNAAKSYDRDCRKIAKQLKIKGW